MASVAKRLAARAMGEKPVPRVIENPIPPDIKQPLENSDTDQTISAPVIELLANSHAVGSSCPKTALS
jgi:hypothetical protein